jgi:hypothetical protein
VLRPGGGVELKLARNAFIPGTQPDNCVDVDSEKLHDLLKRGDDRKLMTEWSDAAEQIVNFQDQPPGGRLLTNGREGEMAEVISTRILSTN